MKFRSLLTMLMLLACVLITGNASAQTLSVSGKVTDDSGEPTIGATIQVKGTTNGTIADLEGKFTISCSQGDVLVVSYIGYQTQEVAVTSSTVNVVLQTDVIGTEEVVVVGYGVQKKKLTTGASVQVASDDIARQNATDAFGALQSQSPGVNITQNSGQPGDGYKVTIRGLGTTGSATPLYVVDGVAGANIEALDPNDIESIDVLKDAASAAIYGARAANGVILVTTKHGKVGKAKITYDGYYGIQNAVTNDVKTLNAKEYMEIFNKAKISEGSPEENFQKQLPVQYQQIMDGTWNGSNWFEEALDKNAPIQNHSVGVSGGSEASRYSLGFSYFSQDGTLGYPATPHYDRITVRANSDYSIYRKNKRDIIKLGENITYTITNSKGLNLNDKYNNNVRNLLTTTPLLPIYNSEGEFYLLDDMNRDKWVWDQERVNPIAQIADHKDKNTRSTRLQFNAFLELSPIEGLKIRSSAGFHTSQSDYRRAQASHRWASKTIEEKDYVEQRQSNNYRWTWENTANYVFKIDKHNIDVLVGQSLEKWGYGSSVQAKNAYSIFPGSFEHAYLNNTDAVTAESTTISGSPNTIGALSSVFGRVNYNYRETYMASLIMRADGSANFAKGHRWGYFPSVSAGWVITNENFAEGIKNVVDFLKLRGSWGQNGNASISNFQYLRTIAYDCRYYFDDKVTPVKGAYPDIIPNEDVSWETSEQLDLGFDARLFKSRLSVTFDWYKKSTKDWLVVAPQLSSYGTGAPYINGGDVVNKGVELAFVWKETRKNFKYSIGVNAARNKNEVTRIDNEEGIIHGGRGVLAENTDELYRVEVGHPMGYFWGYKTAGVFQNQQQVDEWVASGKPYLQEKGKLQPGDLIFVDTDGNGEINEFDKTEIGNPHPDWNLGVNISMSYKGFDLAVNGYGQFGQQVALNYREFSNTQSHNYTTDVFTKYWDGEGSTNKYPRFSHGKDTNFKEISDMWLEDADFFKVSNLTFGYDFKTIWKNAPFQKCRLYFTVQNLCTFTKYPGMDPEVGYGGGASWASGVDLGFYPNPQTIMGGINLIF
ncbi:MAG: TonB-dependent receptor [Bacteroidales bacterium]|nr:TonB-dependent receptor [Bacteroidales bacterium]